MMKDFNELKELVEKRGFGTALYGTVNGEAVYLSRGVREVFFEGDNIQKVIGAVTDFENGNFGSAAENGKVPSVGHEYGRYEVNDLVPAAEGAEDDTAVWIHKDGDAVIVYFKFER